jgi:hypothetical protein
VIDFLTDPDWPLAMSVLAEANGYEVERFVLAEDIWLALVERVPSASSTSATLSPLAALQGIPVHHDRFMAPGDGYALFRNGRVRRLFGRRSEQSSSAAGGSDGR